MKLYHYSVDSYQGAKHLTNDYKNNYQFAEPYIFALRESREVFNAVFFATMYMSREVRSLGLRKYENYQKDAKDRIVLMEVEVEDSSIRRYDQSYYNLALEAIKEHEIDSVFVYARQYYSCRRSDNPLIEVVADGNNTVIRTIAF